MLKWYILKNKKVVEAKDDKEWAEFCKDFANKRVAEKVVVGKDGKKYWVSTVFLAMDHRMSLSAHNLPPIIFETMVFNHSDDGEGEGGQFEEYQFRCCTYGHAETIHKEVCEAIENGTIENYEPSKEPFPEAPDVSKFPERMIRNGKG